MLHISMCNSSTLRWKVTQRYFPQINSYGHRLICPVTRVTSVCRLQHALWLGVKETACELPPEWQRHCFTSLAAHGQITEELERWSSDYKFEQWLILWKMTPLDWPQTLKNLLHYLLDRNTNVATWSAGISHHDNDTARYITYVGRSRGTPV